MNKRIQTLEARLFCKALEMFHDSANEVNKRNFWNQFANIRIEYLDKLEKIED